MLRPFEISFRTVLDILENNWQLSAVLTRSKEAEPDSVRPDHSITRRDKAHSSGQNAGVRCPALKNFIVIVYTDWPQG